MKDDMRLLGARDGIATALIAVRREIGVQTYRHIPAHHTKRIAKREAIVGPLKMLEQRFSEEHTSIMKALDETRTKP